jgi:hypothetical protein
LKLYKRKPRGRKNETNVRMEEWLYTKERGA